MTDSSRQFMHPSVDIVIPVFNEAKVMGALVDRLEEQFSSARIGALGLSRVQYIMVDDGSTDATASVISQLIASGVPIKLLRLSRNFGHQSALAAGLDHSQSDIVVIMDADLQDPPEIIPAMVKLWRSGYDVVYGIRKNRRGSVLKRGAYWCFYRIYKALSEVAVPVDSGDFSLMDKRVVEAMRRLPEKLRFQRGLRAWVGFGQTGVEYERPARSIGTPKYTLGKLYALATNGIASMSTRPLKVAQLFCAVFVVILTVEGIWLLKSLVVSDASTPRGLLLIGLLVTAGNAVQAFCMYLLGAYVGRTYLEVKDRPPYLVMEQVAGAPREGASPSRSDG